MTDWVVSFGEMACEKAQADVAQGASIWAIYLATSSEEAVEDREAGRSEAEDSVSIRNKHGAKILRLKSMLILCRPCEELKSLWERPLRRPAAPVEAGAKTPTPPAFPALHAEATVAPEIKSRFVFPPAPTTAPSFESRAGAHPVSMGGQRVIS